MSARSVGAAAIHWIGRVVGLGHRFRRHCGAVLRLFLAGAVLAVATFIAPGLASATPPANGERPALTGDAVVGSTLYATAGRWSGVPAPTYKYRWQYQASDDTWPDIAGATDPTYEIRPEDLGTVIRVNVTATNSDGSAEQISVATAQVKNPPVTPVNPPPPPPDALGTPANSRVVSADGLHLGVDLLQPSGHHARGFQTLATNSDGAVPDWLAPVKTYDTGSSSWPHLWPRVSAAGRFGQQDFDTVLTLRAGYDYSGRAPAGLARNGGDVSTVPVSWYVGHVPVGAEWDAVPPYPGNHLTPREYQSRWMQTYSDMLGTPGGRVRFATPMDPRRDHDVPNRHR
jgi:hypothetical protein